MLSPRGSKALGVVAGASDVKTAALAQVLRMIEMRSFHMVKIRVCFAGLLEVVYEERG
jgi:hypothetical protein